MNKKQKAAFLTLGCKVNFYETEKMISKFKQAGFEIVDFSEFADVYIVNTCSVTNIADRKSRQMLHKARKINENALVVATGCYAESGKEKLLEDKSVDLIYSNSEKETIVENVKEFINNRLNIEKKEENEFQNENKSVSQDINSRKDNASKNNKNNRTRAYLKIQDGCNQFCTYCLIPFVRGGGTLKSMEALKVVQEITTLVEQGYKEVVLTGIHVSSYGVEGKTAMDFVKEKGKPLAELLLLIQEIEGLERIRLSSLEPRIICQEFLEKIGKVTKLCPHFHLSLQSGCDSVLKRMNRHYTTVEYKEKVDLLRKYYDNPAITTDIIVGFPGESQEEFDITRKFVQEIKFADIHVFPYSIRTGTRAAAMENQIDSTTKNQRKTILINDALALKKEYCNAFLGKVEKVLFEETTVENGLNYLYGHNERYVKIGIKESQAKEMGFESNTIGKIKVDHIFYN